MHDRYYVLRFLRRCVEKHLAHTHARTSIYGYALSTRSQTSAKTANNVEKAFMTMAEEIKNTMATNPNVKQDKSSVTVTGGQDVSANGGCCG